MMNDELIKEFFNRFHKNPQHIFFCPGRVNLIGEHIDYNGGRVLPIAISKGTLLAISKNIDKRIRLQSLNFPESVELHLQESYSKTGKQWFNYPLGIINQLLYDSHVLSGLDMLFFGNLPIGAGLSSSASIEVLTAFALRQLFNLPISKIELSQLSQRVENKFIGVSCGIMDQFAVAMGKKDKAILLNCDSLEYEYLPFKTGKYELVIINSNKQRTLADSKYNERFTECGAALRLLKKELAVQNLCDIGLPLFESHKHLITDAVLSKRALHVISENARVNEAVMALQTGDLEIFGKLMFASHQSLKELYEVSGKELDTIVNFCKTFNGCVGARMTGAGFGGCAIALVSKKRVHIFIDELKTFYQKTIGYTADIFSCTAEEGVREIMF